MTWTVDELDARVARRLCRLVGVDDPAMVTLAALAASAPRGGHVCVDLDAVGTDVVVDIDDFCCTAAICYIKTSS